jgi:hypothetical protein
MLRFNESLWENMGTCPLPVGSYITKPAHNVSSGYSLINKKLASGVYIKI